ncbi:MAG: hypothetical protein EXS00_06715 [Phycisphaerales bacterium]|nr:hypothetical protein [Phycisphaerales bacterium]
MNFALPSVALLAASLSASASVITTATYAPLDSMPGGLADSAITYSSMGGPYAAFPASAALGVANYGSIMTYDFEQLTSFRFVGGVTTVNSTLAFNFYDSAENAVSSFSTTFAQAGNYIWTITIDGDAVIAAKNGFLEITGVDGATGKWFLGTTAPTIGTQVPVTGAYTHRFELTTNAVPAPGAIALLGLAGLVGKRRR